MCKGGQNENPHNGILKWVFQQNRELHTISFLYTMFVKQCKDIFSEKRRKESRGTKAFICASKKVELDQSAYLYITNVLEWYKKRSHEWCQ